MGGGGSKKVTVGHKYYFGLHIVLSQNPLKILELRLQDRTIWSGFLSSGRISVDKEKLFDKTEGGFKGDIDVLSGRMSQGKNDYLQSVLGSVIPAFRDVCSLVFRRPYMGNNPYAKPIKVKAKDDQIYSEWYPSKAWLIASDEAGTPVVSDSLIEYEDDFLVDPVETEGGDAGLTGGSHWADFNPAHIIRHVLVSKATGGDGSGIQIGESFIKTADTLYEEDFGLSFQWKNPSARREFIETVERHVDGSVYFDRYTGKWEFRLIRNDFDEATLPVFDTTNVTEWGDDISRENQEELPNQITVVYRRQLDGDEASVTVTNTGSVQQLGRIRPRKVNYEGIYRHDLAARIAFRDLKSLSVAKWTGSIKAIDVPMDLNVGSPFILRNAEFGIPGIIARVTERIDFNERNNEVTLKFVEDQFSVGDEVLVGLDEIPDVTVDPLPSPIRLVEEVPYYVLVLDQGQPTVDSALSSTPEGGFLQAALSRPNYYHLYGTLYSNSGAGWVDYGRIDFSPTAELLEDVQYAADQNVLKIINGDMLEDVRVGSLAIIGEEYIRIDSLTMIDGVNHLTVGRGVLDTPPQHHYAGEKIIFFEDFSYTDFVDYMTGDNVGVRQPTTTVSGTLALSAAPQDNVVFDARAIRPYPVGDLRVDGFYLRTDRLPNEPHVLSWAHRDRRFQTTANVEDHTYGNIGPEDGVEYFVEVWELNEADASEDFSLMQELTGTLAQEISVGTLNSWDFTNADIFMNTSYVKLAVRAERGGYVNWRSSSVVVMGFGEDLGYGDGYGFMYGGY